MLNRCSHNRKCQSLAPVVWVSADPNFAFGALNAIGDTAADDCVPMDNAEPKTMLQEVIG